MTQAYVPYAGTAGHAGTSTSKERALYNLRTGKEYNNQQKALALLKDNPNGLTWKEFGSALDIHHGTASGVLSVLHLSSAIVRTYTKRNGCKVYVHQNFKDEVKIEPRKKPEKFCPHCGHDINA